MKKTPSRRASQVGSQTTSKERRRVTGKSPQKAPEKSTPQAEGGCAHCGKSLALGERALFVEEELCRTFCSEECIGDFFSHDVERLEAEYEKLRSSSDLNPSEREELSHLRWSTLREPDEVWRQKTLSGDFRYTLISQYEVPLSSAKHSKADPKQVWSICISLFLRGEPSFLFLNLVTRNAALVEHYRRGERVSWVKRDAAEKNTDVTPEFTSEQQALDGTVIPNADPDLMEAAGFTTAPADGLALDGWSTEEALRASVNSERSADDIPASEFAAYQSCIEETLQAPDELWSMEAVTDDEEVRLYHFIKHYPQGDTGFWYLIIAREVPASESEEEHLEVLDAFPSRDAELVARYRVGVQELEADHSEETPVNRVLH